jgi:Ca2+-binding EF-hand superfamily protein
MRARVLVLIGVAAFLAAATQGLTQYPSRGGFSGKGSFDPNSYFEKLANGKNVLIRAEMTDSYRLERYDRAAQALGITTGQITREQFMTYMQMRMAERSGGAPSGFRPPTTSPGSSPGTPAPGTSPGSAAPTSPEAMWDQAAEASFRRHDHNGDGVLNYDEMTETLRAERDRWDTNKDGFIDLNEYKAYYRARMQQRMTERGGSGFPPPPEGGLPGTGAVPPVEEEEPKPVVFRAGKLPKELPAWFKQLDSDNDGQVGLYEWKISGRSIEEFQEIDRNNDGFLTPDEVLRYEAQRKAVASREGDNRTPPVAGNFRGPPGGSGPSSSGGSSGGSSKGGFSGRRGSRGGSSGRQ